MMSARSKNLLYVLAAFFMTALMGGAVYGWPSMRPMLRREGALRSSACDGISMDERCDDQELSLGMVFTVGSWSNQGGRLFVGIVLDRIGPRLTSFSCAFVCFIGSLVFAFASSTFVFSLGFFCIGVGGAGMQLSLQSVSMLFPQNKGLVMAMLSGAFQAASSVFLIFNAFHRWTDLSLRALMLGYAGVLFFVATACLIIWPSKPFGASTPKASAAQEQRGVVSAVAAQVVQEQTKSTNNVIEVPLNKRSFSEQLRSAEYVLMTTFFTFIVIQAQFTIGTIGTQLELKGDKGGMTSTFNLIFSLSWIITPLVGSAIDRLGYPTMLVIMNTTMLCCYACLLSPWLGLQILTAGLYMLGRVSIWATFFSFNGFIFGFKNFGKLAGGGLFIASSFSLVQYPLLELTLETFEAEFAYVNAGFVLMCAAMYLVIYRLHCVLAKSKTTKIGDATEINVQVVSSDKCPKAHDVENVETSQQSTPAAILDESGASDVMEKATSMNESSTVLSI